MRTSSLSAPILAAALTLAALPAHALIMPNGSLSGALIGGTVTTTSSGLWNLGVGTTQIVVTNGSRIIAGFTDPYLGTPNNLLATNGGVVSIGDVFTISNAVYGIANGAVTPFTLTVDGLTLTLTSEIVTSLNNGNIGLAFLGTVTGDTNGLYSLGQSADLSIGFTQSSPTGTIGVGYSIDTPANALLIGVPEPASMALLGAGLFGLGVIRRRSR